MSVQPPGLTPTTPPNSSTPPSTPSSSGSGIGSQDSTVSGENPPLQQTGVINFVGKWAYTIFIYPFVWIASLFSSSEEASIPPPMTPGKQGRALEKQANFFKESIYFRISKENLEKFHQLSKILANDYFAPIVSIPKNTRPIGSVLRKTGYGKNKEGVNPFHMLACQTLDPVVRRNFDIFKTKHSGTYKTLYSYSVNTDLDEEFKANKDIMKDSLTELLEHLEFPNKEKVWELVEVGKWVEMHEYVCSICNPTKVSPPSSPRSSRSSTPPPTVLPSAETEKTSDALDEGSQSDIRIAVAEMDKKKRLGNFNYFRNVSDTLADCAEQKAHILVHFVLNDEQTLASLRQIMNTAGKKDAMVRRLSATCAQMQTSRSNEINNAAGTQCKRRNVTWETFWENVLKEKGLWT